MKLLFVIHAITGGGAERVLTTVLEELCKKKEYEICLYTNISQGFAYPIPSNVSLIDSHYNRPAPPKNILNKLHRRIWKYYHLREIVKKERPDIVISFLSPTNVIVLKALLGINVKKICCEHTNVKRYINFKTNFYRFILYYTSTAVTVLTRKDFKYWHKRYKNTVYLPNPIDASSNYILNTPKEKVILAAGRLYQWRIKGFDLLLKAWSEVCNEYPDWKLCIAGKSDEESCIYLNRIVNDYKCSNVKFLGFRKDINKLMASSEVFCLSSRVEGLPMVLLEAMRAGCCCVSYDCETGPSDIIADGVNGVLVPAENTQKLAEALKLVMGNESLRRKYAAASGSSLKKFDKDKVIKRWDILLNKVYNNEKD